MNEGPRFHARRQSSWGVSVSSEAIERQSEISAQAANRTQSRHFGESDSDRNSVKDARLATILRYRQYEGIYTAT